MPEPERFGWSLVFASLLTDDFPPTRGWRTRSARNAAPTACLNELNNQAGFYT